MKQALETIAVTTHRIGCSGSGQGNNIAPHLGHPLVYLTIGAAGSVDCPYCGRHYVLAEGAAAAGGH